MEFKSLTDKFHYIMTTDELYNIELELAINIVASIYMATADKNSNYMVFQTVNKCREFIDLMNSQCKTAINFYELLNDTDDVQNNACILSMCKESINKDDVNFTVQLEVNPNGNDTVDFLQYIIKDRVIDKNINLRKILKTLLYDHNIKSFIKKYDI